MIKSLEQLVSRLEGGPLSQGMAIRRGIERESLRSDANARLATTPHPAFLGSKLCHPLITTDFSEVQLELITQPSNSLDQTLGQLEDLHRFVDAGLGDELLWATSMPCVLPADDEIPLANYGSSNAGRLKHTYRNGLGLRYGRAMQTICAVHYNFSLSDAFWQSIRPAEPGNESLAAYKSRRYFDLMRNFRRFSWLPVYLYGASPAVANSFLAGRTHALQPLDADSHFMPTATSLRNGGLGYQSSIQSSTINICYNSLNNYIDGLLDAITTEHPDYRALGLVSDAGYRQLSSSILQFEAEYYTTVRAKCIPPEGTNLLAQLRREGVEYIEIRLLDVNPYAPLGIDRQQIRFLDMLLLTSLLLDSPEHDNQICDAVHTNLKRVVERGRDPSLLLDDQGRLKPLQVWAGEILDLLVPVAALLDQGLGHQEHQDCLQLLQQQVRDPSLTPSARMLDDMRTRNMSFLEFALARSQEHRRHFRHQPLSPAVRAELQAAADRSLREQAIMEAAAAPPFGEYLERFRRQYVDLRRG